MRIEDAEILQTPEGDWAAFPGGELEGMRPRVLCLDCRQRLLREASEKRPGAGSPGRRRSLCFQCYRAERDRERALRAAGHLETASEARFQTTLPFEPVDRARLAALKTERLVARSTAANGLAERRGRAQIAARRALRMADARLRRSDLPPLTRQHLISAVWHGAELQLPESWLPFVVSR